MSQPPTTPGNRPAGFDDATGTGDVHIEYEHGDYEPHDVGVTVTARSVDAPRSGSTPEVAKDQAGQVVSETGRQVKDLLHQGRAELGDQAAAQQQRAASGLRSLGEQLRSMADGSEQPGLASDIARQAAERSQSMASWLENHEPGTVLEEVRSFARRRPGAFLALAAGAGVLAGRLGRGLQAGASNSADVGTRQPEPVLGTTLYDADAR